nr:hypothetical protein GCM10020093_017630 [Planobispora longispora]
MNIGDDQITRAFDTAVARIQDSVGSILTATVSGVGTVANGIVTAVLALFLMFFFLKDGPRFLPWLTRQLPGRLAVDLPTIAERGWDTLGAFVRSQAFVGLLDAVFIGLGLWIIGVPLVLPLAVLTFVSAFVPIIGALFAGLVAVLIALVSNGLTDALIVLALIVVVQQLEGNVFQPIVQSRGLGLHAAVVLLAVVLGGSLAGIIGSLLAVPAAALIAVLWNYLREQLGEPNPEPEPVTSGPPRSRGRANQVRSRWRASRPGAGDGRTGPEAGDGRTGPEAGDERTGGGRTGSEAGGGRTGRRSGAGVTPGGRRQRVCRDVPGSVLIPTG